jgi:hypothetical protein
MITKILGGATAASVIAAIVCFNLWQGAKEDLAEQIAQCNTEHLQAALDAEIATRAAQEAAHVQQLAARQRLDEIREKALLRASVALKDADTALVKHAQTIAVLEMEAENDELPDSRACLNAYLPRGAVQWLCRQGEDSGGAGAGAGAGSGAACADTGGFDSANLIDSDFAAITYGGAITRWGQDRRNIIEANGRLTAIRNISGELVE